MNAIYDMEQSGGFFRVNEKNKSERNVYLDHRFANECDTWRYNLTILHVRRRVLLFVCIIRYSIVYMEKGLRANVFPLFSYIISDDN